MSITFIATAHYEKHYPFVTSMLSQNNPNWNVIVFHNGKNPEMEKSLSGLDSRILYLESSIDTGNWGTANRQFGINICDTDYIVQTSIQDYWTPNAVEEILKCKEDFIYWNSINHIFGYSKILDCHPIVGKIDWGNFTCKTAIAKQVGINYPKEFCSDGFFVKDLFNSGLVKSNYKINQILTVHN